MNLEGSERASSTFVKHELIGLGAEVIGSTDPTLVGFGGEVIDETKNTLRIRDAGGHDRVVPKDPCVFEFRRHNGKIIRVEGNRIRFRPEDRIKKAR